MENDAGEQGLALQQLFPYNLLRFFKNSNRTLKKLKQTTTVSRSSIPTTPTKKIRDGLFLDDLQTMNHARYA